MNPRLNDRSRSFVALALVLAVAAAAILCFLVVLSKRRRQVNLMRTELLADVERGGFGDLARAQSRGRHLLVGHLDDREAMAALAFTDAALTLDYGFNAISEAATLLAGRHEPPGASTPDSVFAVEAAASALLLVHSGNREDGMREAMSAAARAPGNPYPLYALGRARALGGDLAGARGALEAAIVGDPGFTAARVAWAEVVLDLGDAKAARAALTAVLAQSPQDLRAQLLLDEARQALADAPEPGHAASTMKLPAICDEVDREEPGLASQVRWPPVFFRAACALARATRARRSGARTVALVAAKAAAAIAPDEPRLMGRIALELAQLGAIDRAASLLTRARRRAAPETPTLAWAAVAVALGRGRAPPLPDAPRPADPETRLLEARAGLAEGGLGELAAVVTRLGPRAIATDADLRLLARLGETEATDRRPPAPRPSSAGATPAAHLATTPRDVAPEEDRDDDDPLRAYVDGLAAQFRGDPAAAAERFWHALSGHGDACRAVGEYVAALRALKLPADPSAWRALSSENAACVNLR